MLDHDLQDQVLTSSDTALSASHLVDLIIQKIHRNTPVLIHSMNPSQAITMARRLDASGFWVTRIPFADLTRDAWLDWRRRRP